MKFFRQIRFLLWHKLAILLVSAMLILTIGFVLTLRAASKRASEAIVQEGQAILSEQAEAFLSTVVADQAHTLDLQLIQAQEAAFYGAYILSENPTIIEVDENLKAVLETVYERSGGYTAVVYYSDQSGRITAHPPLESNDDIPPIFELDQSFPAIHDLPHDDRNPIWGQVHESIITNQSNVIDVAAPIMIGDSKAGYVVISILLSDLIAQFNQRQPIQGSYSFIMDDNLLLVTAPPQISSDNEGLNEILQHMALGETAVEQVAINGRQKYIVYRPLDTINWRIGISVPVANATSSSVRLVEGVNTASEEMLVGVLMAGSLLLIIIILVGSALTRHMIAPLLQMEAVTNSIANGDLDRQVKITSRDEIGNLARSFNSMTKQLRQTLNGLEQQNQQLCQEIEVRKNVESALRESEKQYRQLVELMPDAVVIHSQGKVIYTNPAGAKLLGAKSPNQIIGQQIRQFVPPGFAELVQKRIHETQEEKKSAPALEGKLIRLDTSTVDAEVSGVTFRHRGRPATQLVIRDITERKRLEEQVRLQERLAVVGQLAAGIAHDFNNLLMTIMLNAELIPFKYKIPDEAKLTLEQIVEQGQRAAQLTQQILDFSRKSIHAPQAMDLGSFLKEQMKLMSRIISEKIQVHWNIGPTAHTVFADPTQIQQIISNLVVNARDAMPDGGQLKFALTRQMLLEGEAPCADVEPGDWVVMTVSDSGTGIPEEILPHIFEPFFTTKEVGEGVGLGLAQVYGIVKQNNGCITVNSEPECGSTFVIYLPFHGPSSELEQFDPAHADLKGKQETVLIVEDDPLLLRVTESMLKSLNYRVLVARDGVQALGVYRENADQIDVVLTDAVMPNMDGFDLVESLKSEFENAKIIVMSGYSDGKDSRPEIQEYVQEWLQKPLNLQTLSQALNAVLQN
jgi:PAS domain S-box-containing protein